MADARLLLIRHAQSTWNAAERWQGQADPPLSAEGRRQAEALARELVREPIDVLLTSDLCRAVETAAILGAGRGLEPIPDPRFRELDIGSWTGLTGDEIDRRDPGDLARFQAGEPDVAAGGAESRAGIRRRVRRAAASLPEAYPGCCIALVTHLGVIRALLPGTELGNAEWRRAEFAELAV